MDTSSGGGNGESVEESKSFQFDEDSIIEYNVAVLFSEHILPEKHLERVRHSHLARDLTPSSGRYETLTIVPTISPTSQNATFENSTPTESSAASPHA